MSDMNKWDQLQLYLREEWRLKEGVDYALAHKYGKTHVICCEVYKETIAEAADQFDLIITTWATWSSFE